MATEPAGRPALLLGAAAALVLALAGCSGGSGHLGLEPSALGGAATAAPSQSAAPAELPRRPARAIRTRGTAAV